MKSIKEIFSFFKKQEEEPKKVQPKERKDHSFERFVDAQERMYEMALAEVKSGKKLSHWIWYIFPQLKGLGESYNSYYYGIDNIEEARAYLKHPVLGARLREITKALLQSDKSTEEIFGSLDAMKVRSCMTLFDEVSEDDLFCEVLQKHYQDKPDEKTQQIIECFGMSRRKYGWGAIFGCSLAMELERINFYNNRSTDKRFRDIPYRFISFDMVTTLAWASNLLYETDISAFYQLDNSEAGYLWHSNYRSFYRLPYCTYGHGKAMHTSILGWTYNTIEETIYEVEKRSVNHTKASQAIAACVFMARNGKSKQDIKDFIEKEFGYELNRTCADIRTSIAALYNSINENIKNHQKHIADFNYKIENYEENHKQYIEYYFNLYAPEAITCFLESSNFADAIQLAVSLNTDSPDTLGGMVGAIAEAYYGDIHFNNILALLFNINLGLDNLHIEIKRIMKRFSLRFGNKL